MDIRSAALPTRRRATLVGICCGLLAAFIWGLWPVVSQLAITAELGPGDIVALRFAVAGTILLPVVLLRGFRGVGVHGSLILCCTAGAPYVLIALAGLEQGSTAHAGALIPGSALLVAFFGGWLVAGDRPNGANGLGLVIILAGLGIMMAGSGGPDLGAAWMNDTLFVAAGALWGAYTVAVRAWRVEPLHATSLVAVLSAVFYLPAYAMWSDLGILAAPWSDVALHGFFQGVLTAIVALLVYTRAIRLLGPGRAALFGALSPSMTVLLAIPILGERPGPVDWTGLVAISLGMILALGVAKGGGGRRSR